MNSALTRDRRHRRARLTKKSSGGGRGTHRTALGYLVNAAITISESRHGIQGSALPAAVVVDGVGAFRPPRFGASTGWRDPYRSKSRGPVNAFEEHLSELHLSEQLTLDEYVKRIDYLRLIVEEEGRTIREDSEVDFWDFVHRHPFSQSGQLIVTDEGHLRLVWKGDDEAHIGIRFLGGHWVRYVIFNHRVGERALLETSGEDSFDGLVSQAHACGLQVFRA